jgi:hypothetical protein
VNNPGSQISTVGQSVSLRIGSTVLPGTRPHFYATNLPPGLSISASTGLITGRPKRIGTWRSGVAALDQNLSLRGAFFSWRVGGPPRASALKLSGVASGHPRLALTITAGRSAPWLSVVSIRLPSGLTLARHGHPLTVSFPGSRRVALSAHALGGRLRIKLSKPVWRIHVTFGPGSIRPTGRLEADVQRRRAPLIKVVVIISNRSGYWAYVRGRVRPLA